MNEEIKEILSIVSEGQDSIQRQQLVNYITNLQKENEKLKDTIKKDNHILGCNFSKKDKYKQERDIYKQRNKKAIEYIEKYLQEHIIDDLPDEESKFELENGTPIPNAKEILLNILKGGDEE